MDRSKPITATEIREAEKRAFAKYQEAEARVLQPIIDRLLELVKKYG